MKRPSFASPFPPRRNRKRRARPHQNHTADPTYPDNEVRRRLRGMRADIVEVMKERPNFTAAEIRTLLFERFDYDVPESTIHAQLNALFHLGVTSDHDTPDRDCSITDRHKKTWRLLRPGEQVVLTRDDPEIGQMSIQS